MNNELYHWGVKGMRWGRRKARDHAGPGRYIGKKRQLEGYKKDLEALDDGDHLSVGLTKERQAKFDERDRATLESRITELERSQRTSRGRNVAKGVLKGVGATALVGATAVAGATAAVGTIGYLAYKGMKFFGTGLFD